MIKRFMFSWQKRLGVLLVLLGIIFGLTFSEVMAFSPPGIGQLLDQAQPEQLDSVDISKSDQFDTEGENGEEQIIVLITIVIVLLLIASLVGMVTNRLRLPYTVGLVLIGLALSVREQVDIHIPPEIFLGLLVPPLVFEAAFHIRIKDLLKDLAPILALAIPGVLITTVLVGGVVSWGAGFPIRLALIFGALVAATDPVAVVALFRTLGVPKRLQVLMEGESLLNDGTAIVIFNLMISITLSGVFDPLTGIIDFLVVAGGGLAVGFVLGVLFSQVTRFIDDPLIETTLTTVLAFGSYILAERFHVSGVLAVVAAGLVSGDIGPRGMSPSTRVLVFNFWEYLAYIANSVVFLLIGIQIDMRVVIAEWQEIAWAILAVLVARAVGVYGLSWIGKGLPGRYRHVLFWGGLRGAISLALAISLPAIIGTDGVEIQAMAFGVVLFTILVQGLTMKPLIRKMNLIQRNEIQDEYERRHARSVMAKVSYERLEEMYQEGYLSAHIWEIMSAPIQQHAQALSDAVSEVLQIDPEVEEEVFDTTMREMLLSQRSALNSLLRDSIISEDTYTQLVREVDAALTEPRSTLLELLMYSNRQNITGLKVIVVQEKDVENIIAALNRLGVPITRLTSSGGFLKRKNITLIAGVPSGKEEAIVSAIAKAGKSRVEFLPSGTDPSEAVSSVSVSSAAFFTFEVERYEEI